MPSDDDMISTHARATAAGSAALDTAGGSPTGSPRPTNTGGGRAARAGMMRRSTATPSPTTALDEDFTRELDNAFHDLSGRSAIFRSRLIEEFQLLENLSMSGGAAVPPQYNTRDVRDASTLAQILKENPGQLIKFQAFKRTRQMDKVDRRLTRIRNKDKVPLGAWAGWVVESRAFQAFTLGTVVLNAIMVGIVAELTDTIDQNVVLFQVMDILDKMSLFVFYLEIALKWTDSFLGYWSDSWNLFDFAVTLGTTIPEIMDLVSGTSSGSIIQVVRQLRTFRILRTLKLAVRFTSLRIIVVTILEAFRSMMLIMLLLLMVTYIFAVIGVYGFQHMADSGLGLYYGDSFSNLALSLETLFQFLTLDNWGDVLNDMLQVSDPVFSYVYVLAWVWIGAFIFRNVFVGVMVSNFDRISAELREKHREMIKAKKFEKMRKRLRKELTMAKNTIRQSLNNLQETTAKEGDGPNPATAGTTGAGNRTATASAGTRGISELGDGDSSAGPTSTRTARISPGDPAEISSGDQIDDNGQRATSQDLVNNIQALLTQARGVSKGWEQTIRETLAALAEKSEETLWPRDTLFKYFQLMESLQENMREYQELQMMANAVLIDLHDT
ncbi:hypothetical protein GGF32_008312 [Allomyces javanicus]|nr:hypothetical protein GGF32_008312 [Allomyces javanicus]